MRRKAGKRAAVRKAPTPTAAPPLAGLVKYRPSPEHKTHPGPWGQLEPWDGPHVAGAWYPRRGQDLNACLTDITPAQAQEWLRHALLNTSCWDSKSHKPSWKGHEWPARLFWYVRGRGFFEAMREQRKPVEDGPFSYKGFPAPPKVVPARVVQAMSSSGLRSDEEYRQWSRASRPGK